MLLAVWLFVGGVAILASGVALLTDDDGVAIVAGAVATVTWGVWTFGTLDIERPVEGATGLSFTEPAVTLVGVVLAIVPLYIMLTGPVELISRAQDAGPEDV